MDLRQLRYFATVAETLNFHRAAEKLNIAQPPLSVAIRKLEEEFHALLFRRDKKVELTEAGHAALEEARKALFHASEAARIARSVAAGEAGRVRLAFAGSATYQLLPELIPAFRAKYPEVTLKLREGTNSDILSMLDQHEIDLGVVRVPADFPKPFKLVTVQQDLLVAVMPSTSALATRPLIRMRDLEDFPFVNHSATGRVSGMHATVLRVFTEAGIQPRIVEEAMQVHMVISLVASGLGVGLVPSVATLYSSDKIVFRQIADLPPSGIVGLALIFDPGEETPAARNFRELTIEVLRQAGPWPPSLTTAGKTHTLKDAAPQA